MMYNLIIENMMMLLPLVLLQAILAIICIVKIAKEGVKSLNKAVWILIILFVNLVGPILFLLIGRKQDSYDSGE